MVIDVSGILKDIGGKIEISDCIDMKDTDFLGEMYRFTKPVEIKGNITSNGKSLFFEAHCIAYVVTACARCAKDIEVKIEFDIDEALARNTEQFDESSDIILFDGHEIDIDEIILNTFLMNLSGKYLCKEDCKGLCPVCGADLNERECGCNREFIDPRWQGLADLLEEDN